MASAASSSSGVFEALKKAGKKCRICSDFQTWSKTNKTQEPDRAEPLLEVAPRRNCPADRDELGRCTWIFLHTMAAYYPEDPSQRQQSDMRTFMSLLSQFYPCDDCADHMQKRLDTHPPDTSNRLRFSRWMCEMHNDVNERVGKKTFDCSLVDERWLEGWKDGSCD